MSRYVASRSWRPWFTDRVKDAAVPPPAPVSFHLRQEELTQALGKCKDRTK